VSSVTSVDAD
jgi:glutamate dehydrogenase (NAD(P)+)